MNIRSSECAWHNCDVKVLGRSITGLRGFEFTKEVEKEALYGAGQHALDITEGNIKCSGSITVLGFEADAMNRAARLAKEAEVGELWLTHYSPSLNHPEEFLEDARAIFPRTVTARDGRTMELVFSEDE